VTIVRVAVIGGTGFIGRHLVSRLGVTGMDVHTIDRRAPPEPLEGETVTLRDLTDPNAPEQAAAACGPVSAVAWLAASIRQRTALDASAAEDLRVMVEAPLRFLRTLDPAPKVMVFLSSIQVYGRPRRLPVGEDHPTDPFTAYGVAKLCAEHYLGTACRARGIALANLRVAFVYGPGQHPQNVIPKFLNAVHRGEPPIVYGSGEEIRDDVYVDDVVRAVELALERRIAGTFNIASGRPHTLGSIAEAACRLGAGDLEPQRTAAVGDWVDRWFAIEMARRVLGFEPAVSFEEGLTRMWSAMESAR
jgi:UDP-glucose 4-epimerase